MKKVALAIGTLVVIVLGLGLFAVPTGLERAFMALYDQQFLAAQKSFEQRWADGDRSREVANALASLYLRLGDAERAGAILSAYVSDHPQDTDALTKLAEIFKDAQARDKHIKTLEALYQQSKKTSVLRMLETAYDLAARTSDRKRVLETLVKDRDARLIDHRDLADILIATEPAKALEVLYNLFQRWPSETGPDTAQTFISVACDLERLDIVQTTMRAWLHVRRDSAAPMAVVTGLTDCGKASLSLPLVQDSAAFKQGDPATIVLMARLEVQTQHYVAAFDRLAKLKAANRLPTKGYDVFVEAAVHAKRRESALEHLVVLGPVHLPYWLQSWVVTTSKERNDLAFLNSIEQAFLKRDKNEASFMLARVAWGLGDMDRARAHAEHVRSVVRDASSSIGLAALYADLGDRELALSILHQATPDPSKVLPDDLPPAIAASLALKDSERALTMAEILRDARPGEASELLYARALTQSGRGQEALKILDDLEHQTEGVELAIFEALKATGQYEELQRRVADAMTDDATSVARRTNYVFLLQSLPTLSSARAKDFVEILTDDLDDDALQGPARLSRIEVTGKLNANAAKAYAREAAESDPDKAAFVYLDILKRLKLKTEAVAYFERAIDDAELEATKTSFLYQWVDYGVTPSALPHLKSRADGKDREWFYAYDRALMSLRLTDERREFLVRYAERDDLDQGFKAQIAHELLGSGEKQTAIELFKVLARDAAPRSKDVDQLLFLWGPRPPVDGVNWLSARAEASAVDERVVWLKRLNDAGAFQRVVALASPRVAAGERQLAGVLAEALAAEKMDAALRALLVQIMNSGKIDGKEAAVLAMAAEQRSFSTQASVLYEIAAGADAKFLAHAGRQALFGGQRDRAVLLLEKASDQTGVTGETVFLLAEALHGDKRRKAEAQTFYARAATLTQNATKREDIRIQVLSLARLGRTSEADAVLAKYPQSAELRADLASALMDAGRLQEANRVLSAQPSR